MRAYAQGLFPMADSADDEAIYWVEPKTRGILPLDHFHVSHSLAKVLKSDRFTTTVDAAFPQVLAACANRDETWINAPITQAMHALHAHGQAHSIEVWEESALVGGLYGVRLGRAFFGESMFSTASNASKVALTHLVARLRCGGFSLLDCQFITPHLASLGAIEVTRTAYSALLADAVAGASGWEAAGNGDAPTGDFFAFDAWAIDSGVLDSRAAAGSPWLIWHSLTQTS